MSLFDLIQLHGLHALSHQLIVVGALVTVRLAVIVHFTPFLGGQKLPAQVKLALILALSILVIPSICASTPLESTPSSALVLAALALKEMAIGFTIALITTLSFDAARIAGEIIDVSRGETMTQALIPQNAARASASADILFQLCVVLFIYLGGHRLVLSAIYHSFTSLPPHEFPSLPHGSLPGALFVARLFADTIALGTLIATPIVFTILLANLGLALMNKATPQLNVFFLGMPLRAILGVLMLLLSVHYGVDLILNDGLAAVNRLHSLSLILSAHR